MKILIDALAATKFAGGMTLHAREIVLNWAERYPQDQIIVLAGYSLSEYLDSNDHIQVITWPNESILTRAPGQLLGSAILANLLRVDYTVSLSPIVSPLLDSRKTACFQHDWRHIKNPNEFSKINKFYRKLWEISAKSAGTNFCISQKAATETQEIAPNASTIVVENGRDHARRWKNTISEHANPPYIITFGHHNNKRPELTMKAFAQISSEFPDVRLKILGARGEYACSLQEFAEQLGIVSQIDFPGFVSDTEYENLISGSSVLVMASSDEGFGLPAAEAEYFGIPTVVTSDSGMQTIFDSVLVSQPHETSLAQHLRIALAAGRSNSTQKTQWAWADTVSSIRHHISNLTAHESSL